ncbi:type II toxin-antitoxin system VapC family toxin [Reyranella sp.]|uniref:type II toxin-antitoxin system VapC family toxin n=1 Tax=Reyranella sp. TaxID=1929291 RepID=UPI0025E7D256|nr:type II toxin-antitoxin system VapC family toxin [Reyranella sp.]
MFILDTNVVSELRKARAGRADANVAAWASSVEPSTLYISVITAKELELGVLQAERRDPVQGASLRRWLHAKVLAEFDGRMLPIDLPVAQQCARLHVPDPKNDRDALIAATGLIHGMTVVSRNVGNFAATRVNLLNPWESPKNPN